MNRRYGPFLLFVSVLTLLLPCSGWSAPQTAADATYAKKIEATLPPKVECVASPPTVTAGQIVTLTARVQGVSAGLVYSFSNSGGRLYPDGSTARLDTTGVPAGRDISVTCLVSDSLGRRGSGGVVVLIVARQAAHLPLAETEQAQMAKAGGHTAVTAAGRSEMKAEKHLSGGGDPFYQTHSRAAADVVTQNTQGTNNGAAPTPSPTGQTEGATPTHYQGGFSSPAAVAEVPAPPRPAPAAGSGDAYQQAEQVMQWKNELKNGKIDYLIPLQMKLHETTVVQVVVHGYADTGQNNLPGAQTGTLKVSPRMQMQLTAEDNPDEFEIDPKDGAIQFVPIDGSTTWMWNVTPNQPAENQRLTIRALLVYPDNGQQIEQEITSYIATVNVRVPGFWESLREDFWNDPSAAIKYVLPGGAGFTALAGLTVWWWKRRHPSESKTDKEE